MIRFAVFDESGPAREFPLHHHCLVGKEECTVPGTIAFESGQLVCRKHSNDAAALSLQVDAGPAGRLTLQTCLLPDRPEPYLLDLELARHRIMLLLNKLEEWSFSDLPGDHPVMTGFERARELFTQALISPRSPGGGYSSEQARLARRSLELGIDAGERLAMLQAERELTAKWAPRAAAPAEDDLDPAQGRAPEPVAPTIGCLLHPDQFAEPLQRIIAKNFDFISCPLRWNEIEKDESRHTFAPSDRWIEWAVRTAKLPVAAGPVIDFSARSLPRWIYIWEHDYKTIRELVYEQLKAVVTRYRRTVTRWTVCSGFNVNAAFDLRLEEMIDLTRLCVLTVRKLQPSATILVEIDQPFGEAGTHLDRSIAPVLYAGLVKDAGIAIDGFGLRLQVGDGECGRSTRDLMQLSAQLDTYSQFDKPVHITAIGAPSQALKGRPARPAREIEARAWDLGGDPGHWRRPWGATAQAEWLTQAVTMAVAKPFVHSVAWQQLFDIENGGEMRQGGLITADGRAKPSLKRMGEVTSSIRAKSSPTRLPSLEPAPDEQRAGAAATA